MSSTSLYRHFSRDGRLLYVGISLSWPARTKAHAKGSRWFEQVAKVEIERFPTREIALSAEREAITRERPAFNIMHNRGAARPSPRKRNLSTDPILRQITGPLAIVGPALVYAGGNVSVIVAHGEVGTPGELTEFVLGELVADPPEWSRHCASVLTIMAAGQIKMAEAQTMRRDIIAKLRTALREVQAYDTDIALSVAYASQFPSEKSRRILDEVASERAA